MMATSSVVPSTPLGEPGVAEEPEGDDIGIEQDHESSSVIGRPRCR